MSDPQVKLFGSQAIELSWTPIIDPAINDEVLRFEYHINEYFKSDILETVSTYHTLVVYLRPNADAHALLEIFRKVSPAHSNQFTKDNYSWEIPVCYEPDFGLDLEEVSSHTNLPIQSIIAHHVQTIYRIYFTGFLPGFLYLGGLSEKLHTPRKPVPRLSVPKGAVAIGGSQTGIYPTESPGGWQIIGQTPISLFDPLLNPPSPFTSGDQLRFKSIDLTTFHAIHDSVKNKSYSLQKSKLP